MELVAVLLLLADIVEEFFSPLGRGRSVQGAALGTAGEAKTSPGFGGGVVSKFGRKLMFDGDRCQ